jgi:tetratricopeptide (TPR) repeat protein
MQVLKLARLSEADIADLSGAMLGGVGRERRVVDLLRHETEGNAFFVVEVVRALAERSGRLEQIATMTLPDKVFAGGMREIAQRRLKRVPEDARSLLRLAAVAGREVDLNVLRALDPAMNLDIWATACVSAAVLDVQEDRWRFAHDKLREGVLVAIPENELPALHRQVAEAIEKVYPDDPESYATLAYHFQQAGIRDKAVQYLIQAGDSARSAFANKEAITFYRDAIHQVNELLDADPQAGRWHQVAAQTHEVLGDVLALVVQCDDARSAYRNAAPHLPKEDIVSQARLHRKSGAAWSIQRDGVKAIEELLLAETTLGSDPRTAASSKWWQEWLAIQLERIRAHYWMAQVPEMTALVEKARPIVEQYGAPAQRADFFQSLVMRDLRRDLYVISDETLGYARAFLAAAQEADPNSSTTVWAQFCVGFSHLWRNELDEADADMNLALRLAERIGDTGNRITILAYLAVVPRKQGQIEETRRRAFLGLSAASAAQVPMYIGVSHANLAWVAWREGNLSELQANIQAAAENWNRISAMVVPWRWLVSWPQIGFALTQNQIGEAVEQARVMLGPTQQPQPSDIKSLLESALQAWEQGDAQAARTCLNQASELARQTGYL